MNAQKIKEHFSFILLAVLLGALIGVQVKSPQQAGIENSFAVKELVAKINFEKKSIQKLKEKLEATEKEKMAMFNTMQVNAHILKPLSSDFTRLKMELGNTSVEGQGIKIVIEAQDDTNLAYMMESKKVLILLINEIKKMGAECIAINGQRLNGFSGINLAGNHLNINQIPVAQPYEIEVIGESHQLASFLNQNSPLVHLMRRGYRLKISIVEHEHIYLPGSHFYFFEEYLTAN